ncbi:hypothetical protein EVG20_g11331, partial [Dentipellis fragilis]
MQSTLPTAPPPALSAVRPSAYTASAPPTPSASSLSVPTSKSRGLQLGAHKTPHSVLPHELEDELADESNAWVDGDLMDVNADEDDWTAFESAPAPAGKAVVNAVGLGFADLGTQKGGASAEDDEDPWGSIEAPSTSPPHPSYPTLSTQPRRLKAPAQTRA